jgi:hypothetical protein
MDDCFDVREVRGAGIKDIELALDDALYGIPSTRRNDFMAATGRNAHKVAS